MPKQVVLTAEDVCCDRTIFHLGFEALDAWANRPLKYHDPVLHIARTGLIWNSEYVQLKQCYVVATPIGFRWVFSKWKNPDVMYFIGSCRKRS